MSATDDAITTDIDSAVAANETLLAAASAGDLSTIRTLLSSGEAEPWYESSDLGWSALHYAAENGHLDVVRYLLRNGAIWNAVDIHGITAAQVAWSANYDDVYYAILQAGVAQTLLLGALQSGSDEEDEEDNAAEDAVDADGNKLTLRPKGGEVANDNTSFLASPLRFVNVDSTHAEHTRRGERCLDQDDNMVMSGWETEIMRVTAQELCGRSARSDAGPSTLSVLNIGYGLGIIDDFFQEYKPARHVIIEPHPDVVKYFHSKDISRAPGVELIAKTWEEALTDGTLAENFDVIYADPFAQDYKELKKLFDLLPNYLSGPHALFSFFHGLAGTNRFFYDVYTRLAELDMQDVGLKTTWTTIPVEMEDKEEVWEGVKRKYWELDEFRLPICSMAEV